MADNLESFFKKHLSDETPGGDDWNVPSDSVWENALPEINKKSGVFIQWKYIYIIGILAMIGLAIGFFVWNSQPLDTTNYDNTLDIITENNKNNNIQNTVIAIDSTIIENDEHQKIEQITLVNESRNINEKNSTSEQDALQYDTPENNEQLNTFSEEDVQSIKLGATIVNNNVAGLESEKNQLDDSEKEITEANIEEGVTIITQDIISMSMDDNTTEDSIPLVSEGTITQQKTDVEFGDVEPLDLQKENFNNKGKISVGIFFAPTFTSTYLNGEKISGIVNTSPVYLYSSNFGFDVKYHLSNKLTLVSGVGNSEVKSWSKSAVDFGYDSSTEHIMETGEKENISPIPMPTPFGEVGTMVSYRFDGSENIPDGDMMLSEMETHQKILYLSIPIGVEYNIINNGRLSWFAEGGFHLNTSVLDGSEFTSRIIHYGNEMNVMTEEVTASPNYKEFYLSGYLGTGLGYRFSKSFQFNASARYFGNLTKVNLQDNMTTNVRGFTLKLGINYFF